MRKTNWINAGLCAGLMLSGGLAAAQPYGEPQQKTDEAKPSDQEFLNRALRMNELELRLGRLASERGSTEDVKAKGKKMVQKHTEFGGQLREQARRAGVTTTPEPTPEQAAIVGRLEQLSGNDFDTEFTKTIDGIHQQELAMYKDEQTRASDPQLRALAKARVEKLEKVVNKQPAPPPR
jgi:putative membrane protein